MSKVSEYIDNLFYLVPRTDAAAEMRIKLIESGEDKYEALLGWGKNEEEALGIVVSEFGSMEEICTELGVNPFSENETPAYHTFLEQDVAVTRRFAFGLAAGILICVLGIVGAVIFDGLYMSETMSGISVLLLGGIGAAVITFTSIIYGRNKKLLQNGILPYQENDRKKQIKKIEDLLCSLIMLTATGLFLILGICFGKWHPSWALLPLGGILCGIIGTICDNLKK